MLTEEVTVDDHGVRLSGGVGGWWATLDSSQHQWPLRIVRREQWFAAARSRSA